MNGNTIVQKPNVIQIIAVVGCVLILLVLVFTVMWCAIWKIYLDPATTLLLGTIIGGMGSSLTMILTNRSIPQLNQPDEPIPTEIHQPTEKPIPVVVAEPKTEGQP